MEISDETIVHAVERFAALRGRGTVKNLLAFSRVLKELGVKIGLSQVMDAGRALELVDVGRRDDFGAALRSNWISDKEQIPLFERAFDLFWRERPDLQMTDASDIPELPSETPNT